MTLLSIPSPTQCCISKSFSKEFLFLKCVKPAVFHVLDPSKFSFLPKSSTILAVLVESVSEWLKGQVGTLRTKVRMLLIDYKRAFGLIDHDVLVSKIM